MFNLREKNTLRTCGEKTGLAAPTVVSIAEQRGENQPNPNVANMMSEGKKVKYVTLAVPRYNHLTETHFSAREAETHSRMSANTTSRLPTHLLSRIPSHPKDY